MIDRTHMLLATLLATLISPSSYAQIYVPPEGGEVAEVTLASTADFGTDLVVYQEAATCKGQRFVQHPKDPRRTTRVPAGVPVSFAVGAPAYLGCYFAFRFHPEPGARYLLEYAKEADSNWDIGKGTIALRAKCSLRLGKQMADNSLTGIPGFEELRTLRPFFESGSWCAAKQ